MMQVYKCKHCETRFVVVKTKANTFIPIEASCCTDKELREGITESEYGRHKSHLKNCAGRAADWLALSKKFLSGELIRYTNG
jgi:hypothetical protein